MIEKQMKVPLKIEYHADDYGLFPAQSERILDCWEHGVLNGVSIMPNSPFLQTAMERLYAEKREMAVAVHLNIIEGKSLCSAEEVPLLVDENGVFCIFLNRLSNASGVFEDTNIDELTNKDDLHFLTCVFRNKEGKILKEIHKENLQ